MKKILVTGGAGYIGSHTCKLLAEQGYMPVTFDNLVRGRREAVRWGPLVVGDLLDKPDLMRVFEEHKPDAVLHFAAALSLEESIRNPAMYYRINVQGTLNLIEAMLANGTGKLVFSSSAAVYGDASSIPISETSCLAPVNPYGHTKLTVERMLGDFNHSHNLSWIALRFFNAAGSDPGGEIGQNMEESFHLIPRTICTAAGKREHLVVYGSEHKTTDGTCVRDYIHVNDIASAHLCALEKLNTGDQSRAFNIGNQNGYSIKQVISAVEAVTGMKVPVEFAEARTGDVPILVCNNRLAQTELQWQPAICDLEDIVRTDWNWFVRNQSE